MKKKNNSVPNETEVKDSTFKEYTVQELLELGEKTDRLKLAQTFDKTKTVEDKP